MDLGLVTFIVKVDIKIAIILIRLSVSPSVHLSVPIFHLPFPRPASHNLIVGNPLMAYFLAASLNRVASIFPTWIPEERSVRATDSYTGVRCLQWPHQGA